MKKFDSTRPSASAQPPHNAPPSAQPQSGGGGLPWGKIAAGCGCLAMIGVLVAGVGGYFAYSAISDKAEESGLTEMIKSASEGAEQAKQAGSGSADGDNARDIQKKAREAKENALDPKKIRAYVREPLTKKEIEEHFDFVEEWQSTEAYKDWVESYEGVKKLDKADNDSVVGKMKAMRATGKMMASARKVMAAFDEHVRENGGYEEHYGRMLRIGGVVAASDTIKKAEKKLKDANSDKVAKEMLAQRPEIAAEYKKNVAEAKKAAKEAEELKKQGKDPGMAAFAGMMGMYQSPGTVALARMPEKSFQTWADLSPKERKRLRESLTKAIAPGPWFGLFAVNPAGLLMTAYAAELQEIAPK